MNLRRILCTFSGDDYSIISQSDITIQKRFMAIGGFVVAIFVLCFVSCYFTFTKLFQNYFIGIPIGIFFSYMITNIYLLLLYTLSKNSFPSITDKTAHFFSISIRVIFICFIAIIVSKPIETILFSKPLEHEIGTYKQEQIEKYRKSTSEYYDIETKNLTLIIEKSKNLNANSETNQIEDLEKLLQEKELQRNKLIVSMINLVSNSNYYIQSIVILNTKYRMCWLITLFTMFIFLVPAYLKNFLGEQSLYYEKKRTIETRLVKEEYSSFKAKYNLLFQENLNRNIQFSEPYLNPPFNTIRKKDERSFLKEDDLISDLYNV
jgi:ABC-type multidrug transport system fused ATPase/permease subunit